LGRNLSLNYPRLFGEPVTGAISIVHKVFAFVMVISAGMTIRSLHRGREFRSIELTGVIVAGLPFPLVFISGSLLSLAKARTEEILAGHKVGSLVTVILTPRGHLPSDMWQVVISNACIRLVWPLEMSSQRLIRLVIQSTHTD
jgi:hypothetical protein